MSLSHSPGARTSLKFWGVQGASHACSILPIESDRCLKSERTWCTIYGVLRRSAKNPRGGFVNVVYVRFNLLLYATLRGRLTVLGIDYQCARPSVQCSFLIVHERRLDLGTSSLPLLWHAWNLISLSKQHPICPPFPQGQTDIMQFARIARTGFPSFTPPFSYIYCTETVRIRSITQTLPVLVVQAAVHVGRKRPKALKYTNL